MTPLPQKATGTHPLVGTINRIIDCLREREILPDPTVEVSKTAQGTKIKVKNPAKAGTEESEGRIPRWG